MTTVEKLKIGTSERLQIIFIILTVLQLPTSSAFNQTSLPAFFWDFHNFLALIPLAEPSNLAYQAVQHEPLPAHTVLYYLKRYLIYICLKHRGKKGKGRQAACVIGQHVDRQ